MNTDHYYQFDGLVDEKGISESLGFDTLKQAMKHAKRAGGQITHYISGPYGWEEDETFEMIEVEPTRRK